MAESLELTDKNRRDFLSNISHELRSPITSIKGFIAGILDGIIPMDKEKYYLRIVYDEIQRLTRLVNDLLDLSAMESGKFSFRLTEMDINEIIRVCITRFETKINDKALKVNVTLEGDHLYIAGDRDRLIQVFTNLMDNAIKHCPDNGHIDVHTRIKGRKVYVSVYNDGNKISDEDIKYIWDRFYKSDKSRTNKVSTGLGLPIARNIITQFGEDIWVENKGQGVMFVFTLSMT
jgi:signal transduction histidine kinase